ncbi:flagellar M-ring protein FliF [Spirochaetia bacterium]|nr:flagellar M-ring protein FliF [Spirochaetia bacterium]
MEWLKKVIAQITGLWGKWTMVQRIMLIGIAVIAIGGVVALFSVSSAPTMAPVIDSPIRDEAARDRIISRINEEGVRTSVTATGVVQVSDEATAKRMRSILIREDLIPQGTDPWAIFDRERWTTTDFERNVNLQRAITQMVTEHIKALDEIDDASVTIVSPGTELFVRDQKPVTASVIIFPKPGSTITQDRKKIEGIQKILKFAVQGLIDSNIVITDSAGLVLNDFEGMAAFDRISLIEKEQKQIQTLEAKYRAQVLASLQSTFTTDRVRDLNIKIDMDMSKKNTESEEYGPIILKERTPGLAYDDSEMVPSITRSKNISSTSWEGTGANPEGPAGVEGQTPPAFKDMSNLYGKMTQETLFQNEELNKKVTQEERSPQIDRVTVSVNIDGKWKWKYDEKGKPVTLPDGTIDREYIPVPAEDLRAAASLVQNAVGYNAGRGDSVTVQNIPFDRSKEFSVEDSAYFRKQQMTTTVLIFFAALALLLIGFIVFRSISSAIERKRRMEEEARARREQEIRESAIAEAEEQGVDVSMSVEERTRMELQENAANMAKEHPDDVAQLIRTWLSEE